jgi:hypothetical protein
MDISKFNVQIWYCRFACPREFSSVEDRDHHEETCPAGKTEHVRATNKLDKRRKWEGD